MIIVLSLIGIVAAIFGLDYWQSEKQKQRLHAGANPHKKPEKWGNRNANYDAVDANARSIRNSTYGR